VSALNQGADQTTPASEARRANLKRLLAPRHVAYVGGRAMERAIRRCVSGGFAGPVWVVNPKYETLAGQPCFATIADLPEPPDATFVAVPAEATIAVVRDLAAAGAGGAICYAAGFAEIGGAGRALQDALIAAAGDLALVGPNCYGILNYLDGVALWPIHSRGERVARGAAFVSQSGNLGINVTYNQRSLPFAYIVSAGNQAVLGIEDFIDALLDTPAVSAIGLYVEAITDAARLAAAARRALDKGVPIVALKAGTSPLGAEVALSHTSAIAGSDAAYRAFFDRFGIIRVRSFAAMMETLKLFTVIGPLERRRLAVFTCSGGESALAADFAAEHGIELPPPSPAQRDRLKALLPSYATVSNPLDYNTSLWCDREGLEPVFTTLMSAGHDAAMLIIDHPPADTDDGSVPNAVAAMLAAAETTGLPSMVANTLAESCPEAARARMIAHGVAPLQGLDRAFAALAAAIAFGAKRRDPPPLPPTAPPPPADARLIDEAAAKARLANFGLTVPNGRVVGAAGAPEAAAEIGFPVALKALKPGLGHKTEASALALGLVDRRAVAAAAAEMATRLGVDRFLVEAMVADPVCELMIGVRHDPLFGPLVVVGAGGVLVEMLDDAATLIAPVGRADVEAALDGLKIARLLDGHRGGVAGDRAAVVAAVLAVARFAEANAGRLAELDINPLIVRPRGRGAVVADALMRIIEP